MKKLLLLCIWIGICSTLFAQQNTFKIDYGFYISEELKNIDVENEKDEAKKQLAMTALMASIFQEEDKPVAQAYVNKDYLWISSGLLQESIQITNKAKDESFILYPQLKQYSLTPSITDKILDLGDSYDLLSDLAVEFVKGKEKTIAGYPCKLAQIKVASSTEQPVYVDIWYTEEVPTLYWGEYAYLAKLPGAALQISAMGIGLEARQITKEDMDLSIFQVPEDYTLVEAPFDDSNPGPQAVADNRLLYTDSVSGLVGLMDSLMNPITEAVYTYIAQYDGEQAIASNSNYKYGTMNLNGEPILPFTYDYLAYDENSASFSFNVENQYGLLDRNGKTIIPAKYEHISFPIKGLATFQKNGRYGLVDLKAKEVVPPTHDYILENSETHFTTLENDGKYSLYTIHGNKKITDQAYDYLALSDEPTIFLASKGGKYGYIDHTGKTIIPFQYAYASSFANGVAQVLIEDAEDYIWINTKGQKVKPAEHE